MSFSIRDYVEFDTKGRAQCPCCLADGKKGKNLSVLESGAYKCFRGHTPQEIKDALGYQRDRPTPTNLTPTVQPGKVTVSPAKVVEAHQTLMEKSTHALTWLTARGLPPDAIAHFKLGITRAKVSDSSKPSKFSWLPAISIPIPNPDGTAYWQKKRVAPWLTSDSLPDGYQKWSQYGIPQQVLFTHSPPSAKETWLCEGEWDAMMLGWAMRGQDAIAVACFTCGCESIPPPEQLDRLPGRLTIWYDLDEPGQRGASKLAEKLGDRGRIAIVPSPENPPKGYDISDYLNQGGTIDGLHQAAAAAKPWAPPPKDNPLRARLLTHAELIDTAPDYTDWLVPEILTSDELFMLAASPRAGKSLMAMTLAHSVATGGNFLGRPCTQGPVIYIKCEDSDSKVKERAIAQGWDRNTPVYWLNRFSLSEMPYIYELAQELGARLLVFDTLSRIRDDSVSESAAEMGQVLTPIQNMCQDLGICGLLVHHTGKVSVDNADSISVFDTIRGSSALRGTCRGTLVLAADDRKYRLYVENGWGKLDLDVLLDAHTLNWKLLGNWIGPKVDMSQRDRVLNYLNQVGAATVDQIAEQTNLPKRSLYEVLKRLQADDQVSKTGERMTAVYSRKGIQQIQQLNQVLNGSNPDSVRDITSIQQNQQQCSPPEKVIILPESYLNSDNFSLITPTPAPIQHVELEASNPDTVSVSGIQQQFNTIQQPDQKLSTIDLDDPQSLQVGDTVIPLALAYWLKKGSDPLPSDVYRAISPSLRKATLIRLNEFPDFFFHRLQQPSKVVAIARNRETVKVRTPDGLTSVFETWGIRPFLATTTRATTDATGNEGVPHAQA